MAKQGKDLLTTASYMQYNVVGLLTDMRSLNMANERLWPSGARLPAPASALPLEEEQYICCFFILFWLIVSNIFKGFWKEPI